MHKKAVVRLCDGTWIPGYLPPSGFVRNSTLELLDLSARPRLIPVSMVKWVCFVRDFNSGEAANPERLLRTSFPGRPRTPGLWLRMVLSDGTPLEGLAENDRSILESEGLLLTPPDTRSNTQRIFLPHTSIAELTVVAVVASKGTRRKPPARAQEQPELFPSSAVRSR